MTVALREQAAPAAAPPGVGHVPDIGAFGLAVCPSAPKNRTVKRLYAELSRLDPSKDVHEREFMLIRLATWVKKGGAPPPDHGGPLVERAQIKRLRVLLNALQAFPAFADRLSRTIGILLLEQSADDFFAKTGIPGDGGLFSETINRLSRGLMPQPIDEQDVTHLLELMFPKRSDVEWIAEIPPEVVQRFSRLLSRPGSMPDRSSLPDHVQRRASMPSHGQLALGALPSLPEIGETAPVSRAHNIWLPLRASLLDAILILSSRVSSAGLSDVIRDRSPTVPLRESPFFRLPRTIDALLATPRHDIAEVQAWADDCRAAMIECREACQAVLDRLEKAGVSVDVVYRLELIDRSITRIELLLELLVPQDPNDLAARSVQLLAHLLQERRRERSLTDIVRTNTHLLARKIIERAGESGEHYITVTAGEWFKMFLSAAGGGFLTAFTAAFKFLIGKLQRPPLQEALLSSANYAGSFLLMQFLGFTLATKQPSMTAAAVANSMKSGGGDREEIVTTIARLVRSQIAAAAGNVGIVIPSAIAVDYWWQRTRGTHLITPEYGDKVMASLHPTQSGTIPYAFLTGIILWLSSLCAGWLENWAVYRRLPEAIAEHRIRRIVGQRVTSWASRLFARNIAGIGGNVSIGFMLAFTYTIGQFVGIPVDVRHVTLSTGSLTYAVLARGVDVMTTPAFSGAAIGIAVILTLNLGVSFALAIVVAMRAREVTFWQGLRLFVDIVVGFVRSPFRFFIPVERGAVAHAHDEGHGGHR